MEKPIIYLYEPLKAEQIDKIKQTAENYTVVTSKEELSSININAIEIMLGWGKALGQQLLASPDSQLKWVQTISAGVDTLDLEQFAKKGILLSNASGIHSISIAEHVLGVLLTEYRAIRKSIVKQEHKYWSRDDLSYQQLSGQKLLIVGTGHIGQQLAAFTQGLGIQTYGVNTSGHATAGFIECYSQKNMKRIINEMDIVVNILPLTDQTYQLYDEQMFQAMKPGTVFVNVGRGPSVNTADLTAALKNGQLRFAALDVFEEEPLPQDSELWAMENVLITPHISGLTPHFKSKLSAIFLQNLTSYLTDRTLAKNAVSLKKGY
ncbi:hydroxyacid dehydrogenase [Erwinia sp. CPCC 100877]|nr:hydroxyacid dehydrogenase [Erwinia sp. CPCC 100877]